MEKETNLIDVIIICWKGVISCIKKIIIFIEEMIFLSIRRWYLVIPILCLCTGYALYKKHNYNITYQVEGVLFLYGPTKEECVSKLNQLKNAHYSKTQDLNTLLNIEKPLAQKIKNFKYFDIIDCLNDGIPDYVDYKKNTPHNDTLFVHMSDRLCFRFSLKGNNDQLPKIENAILTYFNNDPTFIAKHQTYMELLKQKKSFIKNQQERLMSLYFNAQNENSNTDVPDYKISGGKLVRDNSGQNKIVDEIFNYDKIGEIDIKLHEGSMPVVLINHLSFEPAVKHMTSLYFLIGWILGCLIAWTFEKRRMLYEKYRSSAQ